MKAENLPNGVYGMIIDKYYVNYSIAWNGEWYSYVINYEEKTTTFKSERSAASRYKYKTHLKLSAVVPLNDEDFTKTIDRMHKLLLLTD